jgi:hypothetical protein
MPLASLTLRMPTDSATTLPESRAQPALVAASVARLVQIRDEINGIHRWLQFSLFHGIKDQRLFLVNPIDPPLFRCSLTLLMATLPLAPL